MQKERFKIYLGQKRSGGNDMRVKYVRIWKYLVLCLLVTLFAGCTNVRLEFDRMVGTAYPPDQTVSGTTYTLNKIYADAGVVLTVNEDDTNIAAVAGDSYLDDGQLDNLETANRASQVGPETYDCGFWIFEGTCTRYFLYGIVLDHYFDYYASNTYNRGILGVMWKTDERSGFAISYKNSTISSDGGKYLRTTAHEAGHAFNLHHQDADGSTTIMTQTGDLGSSYVYEFTSDSETHLQDHPEECVMPGTGVFGSISSQHTAHSWTTTDCP